MDMKEHDIIALIYNVSFEDFSIIWRRDMVTLDVTFVGLDNRSWSTLPNYRLLAKNGQPYQKKWKFEDYNVFS